MNIKKIVSLMCMVSLIFTNFFFCSAAPVNSKKRIAFLGDYMTIQQCRIADRIKQRNNSDVWKVIDDKKLYKKFNIGLKEYIDFNALSYRTVNNKRKHFLKDLSLNVAVIVVSYVDYNIQNVVEQYIQDIDTDNVSVMLVGYICGDNNGRGEEYTQSVKQAARECGINRDNVFFVETMTGDGIKEVDLNIEVCCLENEEPEQEYEEIHHQPIDVIPNVGDVSNGDLAVEQVLDGSDKAVDGEESDNCQELINQEIVSYEEVNDKVLLAQKISQCSKEPKSQGKNKIDWFNILKIGTIGSGISSVVMYIWHKIIPSNNVDK